MRLSTHPSSAASSLNRFLLAGILTGLISGCGKELEGKNPSPAALPVTSEKNTQPPEKKIIQHKKVIPGTPPGLEELTGSALEFECKKIRAQWTEGFTNYMLASSCQNPKDCTVYVTPLHSDMAYKAGEKDAEASLIAEATNPNGSEPGGTVKVDEELRRLTDKCPSET